MLKNVKNYALACLILVFCASCSAVDQAKFENLDRAVKSIQGATMTGVNYSRFGELLQNLATEILIAKDQIKNPKEKEVIDKYSAVFDAYKDSYEVWGFQLKSSPVEKTMVRVIANKYDLVVNPDAIDHSRMVQELWQVAAEVSATIHGGRDAQQRAEEAAAQRKLAAAAAARQQAEEAAALRKFAAAVRQRAEEAAAAQRKLAAAAELQRTEEAAAAADLQRTAEEVAAAQVIVARQLQSMVRLPAGCFMMGSPASEAERSDHERQHRVCVEVFEIGKYEVTQEEWQAVMGSNPSEFKRGDRHPVENVSWNDMQVYLRRLNQRTGKTYRLPTEAEWEYACRGGVEGERYCGGNDVDRVAWYQNNSGGQTHPVGRKAANGFGLYDMSGNVTEWTCSRYDSDYGGAEQRCAGRTEEDHRTVRGGSWYGQSARVRSARRTGSPLTNRSHFAGFRLARSSL